MTVGSSRLLQVFIPAAVGALSAIVVGAIYVSLSGPNTGQQETGRVAGGAAAQPVVPQQRSAPTPSSQAQNPFRSAPAPANNDTSAAAPAPKPLPAPPYSPPPPAPAPPPPSPQSVSETAPSPAPPSPRPAPRLVPDVFAARYAAGVAAIDTRDYRAAIETLGAIERDAPNYRDVTAQLIRAREGLRLEVQAAVSAAGTAEASGAFAVALEHYQRAQQLEPGSVPAASSDNLRSKMRQTAAKALQDAKNFELYDRRQEAIAAYRKALQNLSVDDPSRAQVQGSLDHLQRRQP